MYDLAKIADTIKKRAKSQNILMREMLDCCKLNINAISEMSKGQQLSSISLAKIADYLDCSIDFLMGRTDIPEINRKDNVVDIKTLVENYEKSSKELLSPGYNAAMSGKEITPGKIDKGAKQRIAKILEDMEKKNNKTT